MTAARKVELLSINTIVIPEGRRHLQEDKVCELAAGMKKLGLLQAVTVRMLEGKPRLIDGLHRLNAARALGWLDIECEIIEADDRRARMVEIVANLHRAELMVLDRSEQITELVRLAKEEEEISAQPAQKTGRGRPEGGQSAAAREMGVDRDAVQRAQKIAALPPQAKKIARDLGLADNQSALLKAAKSEDKVSALQQYVKRRRHTPEELAQTRATAAQPPRDQAQQRTRNAPETLDRVASLLIDVLGDRIAGLIPDLQTITMTALANALRERRPDLFEQDDYREERSPPAVQAELIAHDERLSASVPIEVEQAPVPANNGSLLPEQESNKPPNRACSRRAPAADDAGLGKTPASELDPDDGALKEAWSGGDTLSTEASRPPTMGERIAMRGTGPFTSPPGVDCSHKMGSCGYSGCQTAAHCLAPQASTLPRDAVAQQFIPEPLKNGA